jgi:hypothetical protein
MFHHPSVNCLSASHETISHPQNPQEPAREPSCGVIVQSYATSLEASNSSQEGNCETSHDQAAIFPQYIEKQVWPHKDLPAKLLAYHNITLFQVLTQRMQLAKMHLATTTRFLITGPSLVGGCAVSQSELRKFKSNTLKTLLF